MLNLMNIQVKHALSTDNAVLATDMPRKMVLNIYFSDKDQNAKNKIKKLKEKRLFAEPNGKRAILRGDNFVIQG